MNARVKNCSERTRSLEISRKGVKSSHKDFLSVKEAADYLGVSTLEVEKLLADKQLPYFTAFKHNVISITDLNFWIFLLPVTFPEEDEDWVREFKTLVQ